MNTRDYDELFRYLMEQRCLMQEDLLFVDDIGAWCSENGISEPDRERPFRLVAREGGGCLMLVRAEIPEKVIAERINAMSIRGQRLNVAHDRAGMLDSDRKKIAFLFLCEYAGSLPEVGEDALLADEWAFKEMERLGYFKS